MGIVIKMQNILQVSDDQEIAMIQAKRRVATDMFGKGVNSKQGLSDKRYNYLVNRINNLDKLLNVLTKPMVIEPILQKV